jgi:hypothetical protein
MQLRGEVFTRIVVVVVALTVTLATVPPAALADTEPNDSLSNAEPANVGVTESGTIADSNDEDWYALNVTRGEAIEVIGSRPAGTSGDIGFRIYPPSGTGGSVPANPGPGETQTTGEIAETTGTYYVQVYSNFGTGEYNITVTTPANDAAEPNERLENATAIVAGPTRNRTITTGDEDWYAINATRGEAIEVVGTRPAGTSGDIGFSLYDPSGQRIDSRQSAGPGESTSLGTVAETTGTYYIDVVENFGTGSYNLTVTKPANDAFEPNEDPSNATALFDNPRGPISGVLTRGDQDYFGVGVTAGDPINVSASLPGSATEQVEVFILDPAGQPVESRFVSPGGNESFGAIAGTTGRYSVLTELDVGAGPVEVPYTANVTVAGETKGLPNDRFERNENTSDAADVPTGTVDNLAMVDDDRDYFAVQADAGDRIDASIEFNTTANNLTLQLYAPDGTLVRESATATDGEAVTYTTTQSGDHYVAVTGEAGAVGIYNLTTTVIGSVDLVVGPGSDTLQPGNATTYNLTVTEATAGVSSFDVSVNSSNATVAALSGASALDGTSTVTVAPDGSGLTVNVTNAAFAAGNTVDVARLSVQAGSEGTATLNVSGSPTVGTTTGADYPVSRVQGTTLTVSNNTLATLFPMGIPGSSTGNQPNDVDGDGVFEDMTGDGQFNFQDVIEFVFALDNIRNANLSASETAALDHTEDGRVTFTDVIDLVFQI